MAPPLLEQLSCFFRDPRGDVIRFLLSAAISDGGYCGNLLMVVFIDEVQLFVHLGESLGGFGIQDGRRWSSMCHAIQHCLDNIEVELCSEQSVITSCLETGHDGYVCEDFRVAQDVVQFMLVNSIR
ncbi:hypothetical protein Y032_0145g2507 [Ancylostoma ceylanicum]|uniref:Uncharacterized protein n=1 Tax=Ancylostoma ceylanicum TaxID=53326 RepID=A0A016T2Q4_9BILA|nr:hypothetical protein Y032_0145g2507 [Ancylostoma ceylanicum]